MQHPPPTTQHVRLPALRLSLPLRCWRPLLHFGGSLHHRASGARRWARPTAPLPRVHPACLLLLGICAAKMCITWLADSVFTIRSAAAENLKNLTEVFGVEWAAVYLIPPVIELCSHSNYLYRMTGKFARLRSLLSRPLPCLRSMP